MKTRTGQKKLVDEWFAVIEPQARIEAEMVATVPMLGQALVEAAGCVDEMVAHFSRALRQVDPVRIILDGAEVNHDEHRGFDERGDFRTTEVEDYTSPSEKPPFCDHGGLGLVLANVVRERWYSRRHHSTYGWKPSTVTEQFLCGRNEGGTFFAHRVVPHTTVGSALNWVWRGKARDIVARQGDVALITGNGGPRMPRQMPDGHHVWTRTLPDGTRATLGVITHATHPPIPMPGKGQRIVVGRRAAQRGDGAAAQTRD